MKQNLPSRPATATPGFAGGGITATPRFGFGRAFVWLLLAFGLLAPAAHAAPGDVDPLNLNIVGSFVLATAVQPDGKTIIAGLFTSVLGQPRTNIARLNADGTLDAGFNPNANSRVTSVAVQPDGKTIIAGSFTSVLGVARTNIARLNADGTLDAAFNPNPNSSVNSVAVQADGQILLGGLFTTVGGTTRTFIARVAANGTLDAGFNPNANNVVYSVAVQADGQILLGGQFVNLGGTARNFFARLVNDPATQSLTIPSASRVQWLRGGASPEVEPVTFELSTDGGTIYSALGAGTRIAGGWERTGLTLPASCHIRARGRTSGGYFNGSGGLVETVAAFSLANPEIAVASPLGVNIVDGGLQNFGSVSIGITGSLTFTITNSGVDPLNLTGTPKVALAGTNAGDFTVSLQPTSPVATNGTTTFTVQFSPQGGGARTASLSIANDDANENPFDLVLTGTGFGPEIAVEQPAGTDLTSGTSSVSFGTATVGVPVVRTFTVKNTGVVALSLGAVSFSGANAGNFTANTTGMPAFLSAGDQTTFTVTFAPSSAGAASATLSLVNSDTSGGEAPFLIALTGTGYVPQPEIAVEQPAGTNLVSGPATVAFGTAATGAAAVKTFTVKNTGDAALTLGVITFTGTNAGDFTVTTPPVSPVAATNGSTTFTVTFRPGLAGARSATLNIANDDTTGSEAPFLIALTGTGSDSSQVASYGSPGSVTGGWVNGGNFTIGTVGIVNPANNWPAGQAPATATDGDPFSVFLLFQGTNAGLILSPANSTLAYNRLAFTTGGDSPQRDPASYTIFGSTTALTTTSGANIPTNSLTVIASGTLTLPGARNTGPTVVQFANTTAFASYVVVFPTVKNSPPSTITQIAEVRLSQGVSVPHQVMVGEAHGGKLSAPFGSLSWQPGSIRQSGNPEGNNWPAGESPDHALDGAASTKYLHFQGTNAALGVEPAGGVAVINSVSFWTANDAEERDPATYAVYGMAGSTSPWNGGSGPNPWVQLGSGSLALPAARNSGPVTVNFTNTTAYPYYAVVFPTVKNVPATTLMQIGEIAFANVPVVPPNVAPTNITLSNASIAENNAANATVGTLTATDPNAGDTHTFTLVAGAGSTHNGSFTISSNVLSLNLSADFETQSNYFIRLRATDSGAGSLTFEKQFTITITDVTLPQSITFGALSNKTFGDAPFTLSATGGNSGQPVTFSAHPAVASISGNTLTINNAGLVAVTASQTGAGDYSAATPVQQSFTVAKAPQTITFNLATTALTTDTVTLSASGGGSGLPVTFAIINDGPGSIAGNSLTFTGPGTVVVRASQAGSANYFAATNVDRTITVSVPVTAPVITTPTSADILANTATLGGHVTSDGGSTIIERGVVYSLTSANADPLIGDPGVTKVTTNGTTGVFTVPVTGLTASSGYSFKAYAINTGVAPDSIVRPGSRPGKPYAFIPVAELSAYTSVATFTTGLGSTIVTTTNDSGAGSLRQAVLNANTNAGADAITFDPTVFATAQTIVLGSGLPTFTGNTTVTGPAAGVTVQGASGATSFVIGAAANVSLTGLTFSNGNTSVRNHGTATISACVFSASTIEGILNESTGTLVVNNSTIRSGSAISNRGIATMTGCTVITGNSEAAINNAGGGSLTLINCTALDANGTYLFNNQDSGSTVTAIHCTLIETAASYNAGGTTLTLKNSIYRRNPNSSAFTNGGGNLVMDITGTLAADLTALGLDPTGLQNNGGPTLTIALLGGPAINGGVNANVPGGLTTDQRGSGFPRSVGTVDIGAYEHPHPVELAATTASAAEGTGAGTTAFTFTVSRPGATTNAVTLDYAITGTGPNPADAADFGGTLPSGTVTLGIGEASNTITIAVTQDALVETNETFTLTLSNPTAAHAIAGTGAVATIVNDDVAPPNTVPVAVDHCDGTISDTAAIIPAVKLLAGATDADSDPLTLTNVSALSTNGGTVVITGTNVIYTPVGGFIGTDAFSYTVSDGRGGSASATVVMNVLDATLPLLNRVQVVRGSNAPLVRFVGLPCHDYTLLRSLVPQGPFTPLLTFTAPASGLIEHLDTTPLTNIVTVTSYTNTNGTYLVTNPPYSSVFFRMVTQP